ncbi:12588_t:CDS:2 [Funneliformis geosporum]|nr:12588_t:CDS:2 [Funneliformis geosporum]
MSIPNISNTPSISSILSTPSIPITLDIPNDTLDDNITLPDPEGNLSSKNEDFVNDFTSGNGNARSNYMQKKVDKMYVNWKTNRFSSHMKNDTKWIEDTIGQTIYAVAEKVKYPNDECLMQLCYDALLNAKKRGTNMVPSKVVKQINHFLEKMQVTEFEEL